MSVVLLKVMIKNNGNIQTFETKGIFKSELNILIYDDGNKTRNILDFNNNTLKRENEEIKLFMTFNLEKEELVKYFIKNLSSTFVMNLKTLSIRKNDNKYNVIYIINDTDKIEYTVEILKIV